MGQKSELVSISDGNGGELEFEITQLPALKAYGLLWDIAGVVAPAMAKAIDDSGGDLFSKGDVTKLGESVAMVFSRAPRSEAERFMRDLFSGVRHKNQPVMPVFDLLFQGNMLGVVMLQKEALRVNYGNFFSALGGLVAQRRAATPKLTSVQSASSGQHGD